MQADTYSITTLLYNVINLISAIGVLAGFSLQFCYLLFEYPAYCTIFNPLTVMLFFLMYVLVIIESMKEVIEEDEMEPIEIKSKKNK